MIIVYDRETRSKAFEGGFSSYVFFPSGSATYVSVTAETPSAEQIIQLCYDPVTESIRVRDVGTTSGSSGTLYDWHQIMKKVFDKGTGRIRVTTVL